MMSMIKYTSLKFPAKQPQNMYKIKENLKFVHVFKAFFMFSVRNQCKVT